ncbi:MAG: DNA polymerase Y family protein [Hyphomicrobiaceae bacterium]
MSGQVTGARPAEPPLVVVEKVQGALRIASVNQSAARLRLTPGLALADARARIPYLVVAESDPEADARLLADLGLFCVRFTPWVALSSPDGLLLDITGCAHLFGGESCLRATALERLARLGLDVRGSIAGTPDAAWTLARYSDEAIVPEGKDEASVRPLPVTALAGLDDETGVALRRAGLKTIGDLADRPMQALAARFGQSLVTCLARALGRENVRITPLRPPPKVVVRRLFPEPMTPADLLSDVLTGMIEEAAEALGARVEGGRLFETSLFRSDGAIRRLAVQIGRPCRDPPVVIRLYRECLQALADPVDPGFGFDCIELAVPVTEPLAANQPGLDGQLPDDDAAGDLFDRLVVQLGRDRVMRFAARDTHDPDRETHLVPVRRGPNSRSPRPADHASWVEPQEGEPPARPLQMFDPPQPIEILAEMPDSPPVRFRWRRILHEIVRAEGPERIEQEWWRAESPVEPRDYYRVEDAEGRRFWIFRAAPYRQGAPMPRWFLHGVFA